MTTKTVTIGKDGSLVITKSDDGDSAPPPPPPPPTTETATPIVIHKHHRDSDLHGGSFFGGMVMGALLLLLFQMLRRRKLERLAQTEPRRDGVRTDGEYAALARRTANLERIVTDPAQRVGAEIDALR